MSVSAIDYFGLCGLRHKQVTSSYRKLFVSLNIVNFLSEVGMYNKLWPDTGTLGPVWVYSTVYNTRCYCKSVYIVRCTASLFILRRISVVFFLKEIGHT